MEETEKMKGLKKAYAEIILNTAKEAAVRVMASERKVHQFQFDLSTTKDEALRLLLRLKQSMDVKINEAEMKSLNQQKRIEELEAQLQEAEDIVGNLRAELNEAHMKLEEMEHKKVNNASKIYEVNHHEEITKQTENGLPEDVSAAQTDSSKLAYNEHSLANNYVEEYSFSGDPVVPSIIRSKKPELYRNGCTQRIRAYEGNLLKDHFSLSGEFEDPKYEKCTREDKEGERMYVTSARADATLSTGMNLFDIKEVEDVDNNSGKPQGLQSFRRKRKRAARYRASSASTLNSMPPLPNQAASDPPSSQTFLLDSQDKPEYGEIKVNGTRSCSPFIAPSNYPEIGVLPGCETSQGDNAEACTVAMNVNTEVVGSLVMIKEQHGSGECLDVPSSNEDLEMKNSSLVNPDCKLQEASDGLYSLPPKDRVLKYTFQRKRKKESFVDDNGSLHEENPLKRRMVNKENVSHEFLNFSTVAASSRDNRRMAQVARQLLTLSDKKWTK